MRGVCYHYSHPGSHLGPAWAMCETRIKAKLSRMLPVSNNQLSISLKYITNSDDTVYFFQSVAASFVKSAFVVITTGQATGQSLLCCYSLYNDNDNEIEYIIYHAILAILFLAKSVTVDTTHA